MIAIYLRDDEPDTLENIKITSPINRVSKWNMKPSETKNFASYPKRLEDAVTNETTAKHFHSWAVSV